MSPDEQQIRDVVARWHDATRAGDLDTVLDLMTDDVVFLLPGRDPMDKAEFAALSRAAGFPPPRIDGTYDVCEVQVAGDWAFLWSRLDLVITPAGGEALARSGHTLTVMRRDGGRWRVARDANLLTARR